MLNLRRLKDGPVDIDLPNLEELIYLSHSVDRINHEVNFYTPKLRIFHLQVPFIKINQLRPFTCNLEEFVTKSNSTFYIKITATELDLGCLSFLNPVFFSKAEILEQDVEHINKCKSIEKLAGDVTSVYKNLDVRRLKSLSLQGILGASRNHDAKWYLIDNLIDSISLYSLAKDLSELQEFELISSAVPATAVRDFMLACKKLRFANLFNCRSISTSFKVPKGITCFVNNYYVQN